MVGRKIQQNSHLGTKGLDGFELKAANLRDGNGRIRRTLDQRKKWHTYISADEHRNACRLQNVRDERRSSRFAVRAGNADERAAQESPRQFNLTPNGDAAR